MLNSCVLEALIYSIMACSTLMSQYFTITGFSPSQIGLLMALMPLTAVYGNYIYFSLVDRFSTIKIIRIFSISAVLSSWLLYISEGFAMKFLFMAVLAFFQASFLPLIESAMIDLSEKYAFSYNKIRIFGSIGYAVAAFLIGQLVRLGFEWLFIVLSVIFVLINLLIRKINIKTEKAEKNRKFGKVPSPFLFLFIMVTIAIGFNLFNSNFLPVFVKHRNYNVSIVGTTLSLMALSEVPFLMSAEKIRKKISSKFLFLTGILIIGVRLILVPMSWSTGSMVLIQMLHGWTFIVVYYSTIFIMREALKGQTLRSAQTLFWIALQGVGPLLGSTMGGIVVDSIGISNTYITFGAICLVTSAVYSSYFIKKL